MSERVAENRMDVRPSAELPSQTSLVPMVKVGSQALRIDGPEPISAPVETSALPTPSVTSPASPWSEKARQLADVGQFVLQMQEQVEEITRRERQFSQRLSEFESEERRFRSTAHDTETELAERKAALLTQEAALAQRMLEFDQQQREFDIAAVHLEADCQALDRERSSLRQDIQRELDDTRHTLAAEREALNLQQAKVQELGDALLELHRTQQTEGERQLLKEREQLWISLSQEWEAHRAKFEQEKAEFLKDRTLLENRLRFQQDHLEKTRGELERDQQITLHERQIIRQRLEAAEQQLYRRKSQLDRFRDVLEELERALQRDRELNSRLKAAISSTVEQERQQHAAERQAWDEERRQQQAELRRQQELLLTHTENLETRRLRLESLRREVEETNHSTIEMRLAVEDVWAQLQQSLGLTVAQQQVEQARLALSHDYEHLQARLQEQRRELHEAERHFEQQRLGFQAERRTLTEWIAARDQELLRQEQRQQRQAQEQATQDHAWQDLQERWLRERAEAEEVIRRLLHDVVDRLADLPDLDASACA